MTKNSDINNNSGKATTTTTTINTTTTTTTVTAKLAEVCMHTSSTAIMIYGNLSIWYEGMGGVFSHHINLKGKGKKLHSVAQAPNYHLP